MEIRYCIDVRIRSLVRAIYPNSKLVSVVELSSRKQYQESYDKLVLSPGAEPVRPPLPGIDLEGIFTLRNLAGNAFLYPPGEFLSGCINAPVICP